MGTSQKVLTRGHGDLIRLKHPADCCVPFWAVNIREAGAEARRLAGTTQHTVPLKFNMASAFKQ